MLVDEHNQPRVKSRCAPRPEAPIAWSWSRWFIDFILHLDKHLIELIADYHYWIYAILFVIIFCETGVVVTPILPGDSLLFALGALAAVDTTGTLNAPVLWGLLMVAAWLGDATNFRIGPGGGAARRSAGPFPG